MYTLALVISPDIRKVEGGVEPDRQNGDTKALKLYERCANCTFSSPPSFSNLISHQSAVQHGQALFLQ